MDNQALKEILDYLDEHNREFMKQYYASRHVDSVQNFELETVALSGAWLDVKKRYAQVLLWKDGKTYLDGTVKERSCDRDY